MVRSFLGKRRDGKLINHFARLYQRSFLERRRSLRDQMFWLNETYRMTEGLQEPSSRLFYGGHLTFSKTCTLDNRPLSQDFIRYMSSEYSLAINVPRLVLHLPHGVSQVDHLGSRSNPYNVVVALREIKKLLHRRTFKPTDICIAVPYRRQATLYSQAIEYALQLADWQGLGLDDIQVMTIDSLVAGEAEFVVL